MILLVHLLVHVTVPIVIFIVAGSSGEMLAFASPFVCAIITGLISLGVEMIDKIKMGIIVLMSLVSVISMMLSYIIYQLITTDLELYDSAVLYSNRSEIIIVVVIFVVWCSVLTIMGAGVVNMIAIIKRKRVE